MHSIYSACALAQAAFTSRPIGPCVDRCGCSIASNCMCIALGCSIS